MQYAPRVRAAVLIVLLVTACSGKSSSRAAPDGHAAPKPAARPDATPPAACPTCGPGEICVQRFDGTCRTGGPECIATTLACPADSCSDECEAALCGGAPYQCDYRTPCGGEAAGAFTCYGP